MYIAIIATAIAAKNKAIAIYWYNVTEKVTEEQKLDENVAYSPPDKGHYFDNEITPS